MFIYFLAFFLISFFFYFLWALNFPTSKNEESCFSVPPHLEGKIVWVGVKREERIEQMLFIGFKRFSSGLVLVKLHSRRGHPYYFSLTEIFPVKGQINPLLSLVPEIKETEGKFSKKTIRG